MSVQSQQVEPSQTTPYEYFNNTQQSINAWQELENETLSKASQKLQEDLAVLETLPTQAAYMFSTAVMGQTTQVIGIQQVAGPSDQVQIQNSMAQMATYIQSLWGQLSSDAQGYNPTSGPTSSEQGLANDLYLSLQDMLTLCKASLNPDSPDYGFLNPDTANSLISSLTTVLNSITNNGIDTSPPEIANNILTMFSSYDSNPSSSSYSTEINDDSNALNTTLNTLMQASSVMTGELKTSASELQQFFGAVESGGQSQVQAQQYFIQNEMSN